jgi:predicted transposase YdaD
MEKGGFGYREAEKVTAIVEMGKRKEYGGMYEAVIESFIEEREEARAEGRVEGLEKAARNLLAKGATVDYVHEIAGLDKKAIRNLTRNDKPR